MRTAIQERLSLTLQISIESVIQAKADAREIPAQCPDVALAAPYVRGGAQVVNGNNNWATIIYGVTSDYLTIRQLSVADGAEFTQQDVDSANKVAVLGKTPVDNLFGGADPIGQTIRIKNVPFTVVGVLTPKGQSAQGQDQNDVILLPISTAIRQVLGGESANADAVDTIMMQAKSDTVIQAAQDGAQALLRQPDHLQVSDADDFSIRNLQELFAAQEASSSIVAIMLAAVASVSLVVGGIGIMNIILISVRERTREIGLRQAIGAKTRDILTQFLVEAITLSIAGGLARIAPGIISFAWGSPIGSRLREGVTYTRLCGRESTSLELAVHCGSPGLPYWNTGYLGVFTGRA